MPKPQSPAITTPKPQADIGLTPAVTVDDDAEPSPLVKKLLAKGKKQDTILNDSPNDSPKTTVPQKPVVAPTVKPKKTKAKPTSPTDSQSPNEFMANEYKGVSIYAMTMAILIGLILWTGIASVQQVQAYHQQYSNLQQLKKDYRNLQIENQRLLIEQQTFSATPQIASRAVAELNMFYPQLSDRMIIQANNLTMSTNAIHTHNLPNTTPTNPTPNSVTPTNTALTNPAPTNTATAQIENDHVSVLHPSVEDPDELRQPDTTKQGANP